MDFIWLPVLQLTVIEGRLIITGYSMGGSVASLFTLCLLEVINLSKPKCRPICITFGSPLIGDFGLQHSNWNSFFLHVVSNQDLVPGLFLPSDRSPPTSSHSQTTGYKPFGTYLLCSELGCACFDNSDLILELLKVISSEVARGLRDVDYRKILRNLKERAICKGLPQVGERFANPFAAGIIMELETNIGFNETKLCSVDPHPSSFMKRWKELEEVIDTCYRSFMKYGEVWHRYLQCRNFSNPISDCSKIRIQN
uniref:Fungal lipase-type domain-containing protein n=1 Tax=Vitis vinifera TaxID=29760 RepID=A5BLQ2_VITVI|nr:hypothetical protein VITISV_006140 [Vitis vinifera]